MFLKQKVHFPILSAYIRSVKNIEKYIVVKNNQLAKHVKKWGSINWLSPSKSSS